MRQSLTACVLLFTAFSTAGWALQTPDACDKAALAAAAAHGVPPQLMLAIARVETGRKIGDDIAPWPWTVNQAGIGHWFETPADAVDFVQQAIDAGQTNLDIGCFQLNLRWHAEGFSNLQTMFAPDANANYAAQFLDRLYAQKGNWVDAAAAYHSATPEHAQAYVEKVEAVLAALAPLPESLPVPVLANRFPLLQAGGAGAIGSLVPQVAGGQPLIAAER